MSLQLSDWLGIAGLLVSALGVGISGLGFGFAIWQLARTATAAEATKVAAEETTRAVQSANKRMLLNHLLVVVPQLRNFEADLDAAIFIKDHVRAMKALVDFSHAAIQVASLLESQETHDESSLILQLQNCAANASTNKGIISRGTTRPLSALLQTISTEISAVSAQCAGLSAKYQLKVA